jgi:hypothetical protein
MSTTPALIVPPEQPQAVKVPAMVKKSPLKSEPAVEKTYVPLKFVLLKPPVGGGAALFVLLQPINTASVARTDIRTNRFRNDIATP